MESGLQRDMFNHEMTTPEHWRKVLLPNHYSKEELRYTRYVSDPLTVTPSYDPMCLTIEKGCYPVRIISAEKLVVNATGPAEGRKIAELINGKEGFDDYMIDEEAWGCIWNELIINKRGLKTFLDRDGLREDSYDFSFEMYNEMWYQLDRLINKYGDDDNETAQELVALLREHQESLDVTPDISARLTYEELMEYHLGMEPFFSEQLPFDSTVYGTRRDLKATDIMGPRTRAEYNRRKNMERDGSVSEGNQNLSSEKFDFSHFDEYFHQQRLNQLRSIQKV